MQHLSLPALDNLGDSIVRARKSHRGRCAGERGDKKELRCGRGVRLFMLRSIHALANGRHPR